MCATKFGSATSFRWDAKPRSSLCSTTNMDLKDPDITEEEKLSLPAHTDTSQTGKRKKKMSTPLELQVGTGIHTSNFPKREQ